jgi:hypothetical protein
MRRSYLLIVTAWGEMATGAALLAIPTVPLRLLLGVEHAVPETVFVARVAGAALLAIGIGCWLGPGGSSAEVQRPLIGGVLVYSTIVALLLAYAGLFLDLAGIALWPAVAVHILLSLACAISLFGS